jgi:DNA-binding NtrC family response regulator
MKKILFIDRDEDIRHFLSRCCETLSENKNLNIRIVASVQEAEGVLSKETFDGIVIDAVTPGANKILPFIKQVRNKKHNFPIIALVGFVDMILDDQLKKSLGDEQVTIVDKIQALHPENIAKLFELWSV